MSKSTKRVPLSQPSKDLLWSESGGHCQNPDCRADLHSFVDRAHIAELAHIIPASADGPRAEEGPDLTGPERALPENVLVLCPTCHTVVDKAPEEYPADVLRAWNNAANKHARLLSERRGSRRGPMHGPLWSPSWPLTELCSVCMVRSMMFSTTHVLTSGAGM